MQRRGPGGSLPPIGWSLPEQGVLPEPDESIHCRFLSPSLFHPDSPLLPLLKFLLWILLQPSLPQKRIRRWFRFPPEAEWLPFLPELLSGIRRMQPGPNFLLMIRRSFRSD